ncbi:adenosine kinase [Cerasicoccus arenae]|uniref:Adenosine kinase n=1 Tax=Cerasicoccus arenae TaxID=424488 RepID=A0A8J3GEQ9_9BACT|nr:adenosine kinase [Cerasicoccus arenae]MBK1857633.1 adenosine kinase [Cerasicoccus arenae]GHC05443.1 adenosine kinase [Cerasicoccus arenae]
MANPFKLIGVGSPVVDTLASVNDAFLASHVPGAKGGMELVDAAALTTIIGEMDGPLVQAPGGSAGNTAVGVAQLGLPTTFLGKLGNDANGTFYRDSFKAIGGDISRFKVGSVSNGHCLSMVTPDSQRTMRTDLGAAMTLSPDEISSEDFAGVDHAHIEGYLLFNRDLLYRVLECAKQAGCTISLDLASFEVVGAAKDILPDVLRDSVDIVFANEDEAGAFTDMGNDYVGMAAQLSELCGIAAVKLGKSGSLVQSSSQLHRIEPVVVDNAIDTTGAGDLWAAGFLYGWLSGKDLPTCGLYGSILGAEVVQVMGGAISEERWEVIRKQLGGN